MKKITLILAGIVATLSLHVNADGRVTIFTPGQSQSVVVNNVANLSQLVTNPVLMQKTWWPGTVIAERQATAVAVQQQQLLLARLQTWRDELKSDDDGEQAAVVENLRQQIASIRVTGRKIVNLDPDWVRLRPQANRTLAGEYSVYTLTPPTSVTVVGVVANAGKTPWAAGRSVVEYLDAHPRMNGGERNTAWVISPGGEVTEVPVAYWNRRHDEPQPGSILFVGFSSWTLPSALADLNQQIVSVLTHRIPD